MLFYFGHQTLYGVVVQHDNARPHAPRHTAQFLANKNVQIPRWRSMPPDLKPVEHIWKELDRRLRGRVNTSVNVRELFQAHHKECMTITAQVIHNLIQSVPMRC